MMQLTRSAFFQYRSFSYSQAARVFFRSSNGSNGFNGLSARSASTDGGGGGDGDGRGRKIGLVGMGHVGEIQTKNASGGMLQV